MFRVSNNLSAVLLVGVLALSRSEFAYSQDPGAAAPAADGVGAGVQDPDEAASNCIREAGFTQGYSKSKGTFVVAASAGFACGPDNPEAFTICRNAAFQKAMLDAKKQIAEFLAAEISSCVKTMYVEPSLADPAVKAMGAERAHAMVKNSGGNEEAQKQLLASDQFSSAVSVTAKQEVAAVQCFRSFESISEGNGRVAVVAILSPKSILMAKAMLGQETDGVKGAAKEPVTEWISKIDSEGMLLYTHGVIQRTNENGELCLVAFGQASPRTARGIDGAYKIATGNAQQALRQFAGEFVQSASDQSTAYTLKEFADKTSEFTNDSTFSESVTAVAAKLAMPGMAQVKRTSLKHPLGGDIPTAVVVYEWNVSSADAAGGLKATLDEMRGSEGGAGRPGAKPAQPKSTPAPAESKPKGGDSGGRGGSGSPDDT